MWAVFWIDEVCFRYKLFDGQMPRQDVLDLNWHNIDADTSIVLHVKHACELITQPSIVAKCIYTDVLTILLFRTNNKEGIGRSKAVVLFLLIRCSLLLPLVGFCDCSMFCCTLLHVFSSFAIIMMGKRELVALLCLTSWRLVALPHRAVGWPAVCDCGIFWSYSLIFHTGPFF